MSAIANVVNRAEEYPAVFRVRFWRSYGMLHLLACRVLDGPERAEDAIENCWYTASRNPPHFEHEGEFRSWLVRILIEEVLALLFRQRRCSRGKVLKLRLPR